MYKNCMFRTYTGYDCNYLNITIDLVSTKKGNPPPKNVCKTYKRKTYKWYKFIHF